VYCFCKSDTAKGLTRRVRRGYHPAMSREELLAAVRARTLLASGKARDIRERAGVSRDDAGRAIGASGAAITHWESGLRRPRTELAARYGQLLDELAYLTAGSDG
jgi:DNA-binding XRE family transcriptional regulator